MENNKTKKYSDNYQISYDNYTKAYNYLLTSKQVLDDIEKIIKTYNEYTKDYKKKLLSVKANIVKTFYVDEGVKLKTDDNNYKTLNTFIKTLTEIITNQINRISEFFHEATPSGSIDDSLNKLKKDKSYLELEKKKIDKNFLEYDVEYNKLLTTYKISEEIIRKFFLDKRKNKNTDTKPFTGTLKNLNKSAENLLKMKKVFEQNNSNFFKLYDNCIKNIYDELNEYNSLIVSKIFVFINNSSIYHTELSKSISNSLEKNIIKENLEIVKDFGKFQENNFTKIEKNCEKEKYHVKAAKETFIETKIEKEDKEIMSDLYEVYGFTPFKDEHVVLTAEDVYDINKIFQGYEFVDASDYDLTIEKKKIDVQKLTNKILFFKLKEKPSHYKGLAEITEKELNEFYQMLEKKQYRLAFLQRLNNYRALGCFELPEKEYNILLKCMLISIDKALCDNDIYSTKLILILSQTFYKLENDKKIYLFKGIFGHKIFQEKTIWIEYLNYDLKTEEEKFIELRKKNNLMNNGEAKPGLPVDGVFGQILPFCSNMIDFGMSEETLKEIINPIFEKYKFEDGMKKAIEDIIKENIKKITNK